jgi:hypothetical protein
MSLEMPKIDRAMEAIADEMAPRPTASDDDKVLLPAAKASGKQTSP